MIGLVILKHVSNSLTVKHKAQLMTAIIRPYSHCGIKMSPASLQENKDSLEFIQSGAVESYCKQKYKSYEAPLKSLDLYFLDARDPEATFK